MRRDRAILAGILAVGVLLLLLPLAIRALHHQPLMPGSEGYGHARIAGVILQQGIPAHDPAMPERVYAFLLFDFILAGLAKIVGIEAAALLLPFLLGVATLGCMTQVVRKWKIPSGIALGAQFAFVLSPLFADVFTQATPRALQLFLFMLYALVLAPSSERPSFGAAAVRALAAVAIAAALATFGIIPAIAAFAVPMLLRTVSHKVQPWLVSASVAAFIVLVAFALPAFLQQEQATFNQPVAVVHAISDFGGNAGLSLFAWMLAIIGIIMFWRFKKRYYALMFATAIALAAALLLPSALVVAHIIVSFLAGAALAFFAEMKWSFDDIRTLTLLVLLCGLLFSTLSHSMALAQGPPDNEFKNAALAMQTALPENATILSYPDDGFWLEYWSGKRAFLDGWTDRTPRVDERWAATQAIWHAQDITRARQTLYANKIDAVVITQDMRDGLVWDLPEQELLFLLRNNETFKRAQHSSIVDIWAVKPEHS